MRAPLVSVLLPVRNGLPWLPEALRSLSHQTLRAIEIVVLEDGSTDGTPRILAMWPDPRVRVVPTGGVGIAAALNVGLSCARAPLVARHDADDVSLPERLATQAAWLDRQPDIDVLASTADYIDTRGRTIENAWVRTIRRQQDVARTPDAIRALMPLTCCVTHGSVMARTAAIRAAGGYRAAMSPAEDYDLWLRMLPHARFAKLARRLYRYRVHDRQVSTAQHDTQVRLAIAAKLAYLRRQCAWIPPRARLSIAGGSRGGRYYEAVAPALGFATGMAEAAGPDCGVDTADVRAARRWARTTLGDADVVVVTDFGRLPQYRSVLIGVAGTTPVMQIGNFFVPIPRIRKAA